ncbi:hypothetical protein ENBRE01_1336 [Enteropsectra breve]|nr:hypothetical protein ENBRE01_1336 [Enteropsectra breve]
MKAQFSYKYVTSSDVSTARSIYIKNASEFLKCISPTDEIDAKMTDDSAWISIFSKDTALILNKIWDSICYSVVFEETSADGDRLCGLSLEYNVLFYKLNGRFRLYGTMQQLNKALTYLSREGLSVSFEGDSGARFSITDTETQNSTEYFTSRFFLNRQTFTAMCLLEKDSFSQLFLLKNTHINVLFYGDVAELVVESSIPNMTEYVCRFVTKCTEGIVKIRAENLDISEINECIAIHNSALNAESAFYCKISALASMGLASVKYMKIDVLEDLACFIRGKGDGKIKKIAAESDAKIKMKSLECCNPGELRKKSKSTAKYTIFMISSSDTVQKAVRLLYEEFPAEHEFDVSQIYHKKLIGYNGENIKAVSKRHSVYIKFRDGKSICQGMEKNTILLTPMKYKANLSEAKSEILELVEKYEHQQMICSENEKDNSNGSFMLYHRSDSVFCENKSKDAFENNEFPDVNGLLELFNKK